jgi:DedD protein
LETKLKYRMVGILALTALAVIFIPIIFSGSEQDRDAYLAEIPKGPGFKQGRRVSVIDLQAEMRARERESASRMPLDKIDQTDYVDEPGQILDQNGLPIGWSLQVASFRDQDNALR